MVHELVYLKKNRNVKSVKILMMSGMPFHFNVLDFWYLYTSAMITWVRNSY